MGSPARPTTDQETKLKAAGQLEMMASPEWVDVTAGEVKVRTEMPRQATSLLRIHW
jgi:xylan 1,4-beta-xylosidase